MAFPQARRIARTRRVDGVSATWIGVSLAINAWWLAYGLVAGVWALVPVSIISLLLYGVMAWFFVLSVGRAAVPGLALGVFGLGMVPLPFLLIGGWELAGVAVGLSYGVQLLPAVVASLRTSALSGVSSTTWIIASVEVGAVAGLRPRCRRRRTHARRLRRRGHGLGDPGAPRGHRAPPVRRARSAPPPRSGHGGLISRSSAARAARWTIAQPSLA